MQASVPKDMLSVLNILPILTTVSHRKAELSLSMIQRATAKNVKCTRISIYHMGYSALCWQGMYYFEMPWLMGHLFTAA